MLGIARSPLRTGCRTFRAGDEAAEEWRPEAEESPREQSTAIDLFGVVPEPLCGGTRFPRRDALDDPQLRALEPLDIEPLGPQVLERLAEQVVGLEANRERVEQPLRQAHRQQRAAHMLEQNEPPARPQHPPDFGD